MKVTINNKIYEYEKNTTLEKIKEDLGITAYAATVNNRLRELTYKLTFDAEIRFLDLTDKDAMRIYEQTLRYVILMAVKELNPKLSLKFNYSISRSILAVLKI